MDIEEDIRVLQLDSSEDANVNANAEDSKPQEVEQVDKMEEVKYQSNSASEDIEEEREDNKKRHLNFVFIGHVDAGKSTTGGQILFLSGRVDDRTIQKYEKEAKDKSRESWLPIIDKFKDMGTVVMGKVESGSVSEGDNLLVMPNKAQVKVTAIYCDEDKARRAGPGENLRIRLSGIEEEDILSGFVLSSVVKPIPAVSEFVAQLQILELLDNAIFTAG